MLYPLQGVNPANTTQGGFRFGEWNSYPGYAGDAFHPGTDYNAGGWGDADCGSPCPMVAFAGGTVRRIVDHTSSYGWHVWIETDAGTDWLHYCHLSQVFVVEGEYLARGEVVGLCGKSAQGKAEWAYCHQHFEVMKRRPPSWDFWPLLSLGYTRDRMLDLYHDPEAWLAAQDALAFAAALAASQTIGAIDVDKLTDEQIAAVGKYLWGDVPFNPDSAIAKAWASELRAGRYRGIPDEGEAPVSEDGVIVQRFIRGDHPIVCVYAPDAGAAFAE